MQNTYASGRVSAVHHTPTASYQSNQGDRSCTLKPGQNHPFGSLTKPIDKGLFHTFYQTPTNQIKHFKVYDGLIQVVFIKVVHTSK